MTLFCWFAKWKNSFPNELPNFFREASMEWTSVQNLMKKNNCGAMVKRLLAGSFGSCVSAYLLVGPVFYTLRRYVNYVLLKMLYVALVRTPLLWHWTSSTCTVRNAAKRNFTKSTIPPNKILHIEPKLCCVQDLCKKCNTLLILEFLNLQLLRLIHKYVHCSNKLPDLLANYFSSNNDFRHHHSRSSNFLHFSYVNSLVERDVSKLKLICQLCNTIPGKLKIS